jgi:hypothetical protein
VQAARGRLFFSEAEKSESGTVPMHKTGIAVVNAKGHPSTRMESSSSPIFSTTRPKTGDGVVSALKRKGYRAAGSHVEKGVFLSRVQTLLVLRNNTRKLHHSAMISNC